MSLQNAQLESFVLQLGALLDLPRHVAALEAEIRLLRETVDLLRQAVPPMLVTVADAAKALKVSVTTVRRRIRSGELPVVNVGRSQRVDLAAVRPVGDAEVIRLANTARSDSA